MSFPSDLEIAQSADIKHIKTIAAKIGIDEDDLHYFGKNKAKLPLNLIDEEKVKKAKLILVSAINPTPAGEGKTTVSIGLNEGLNKIGKKAVVVLREPSLGPVFGKKVEQLAVAIRKLYLWRILICILQATLQQ
jgi:formate--tetrahydrofolate ligase